jgi:hypothetical protein
MLSHLDPSLNLNSGLPTFKLLKSFSFEKNMLNFDSLISSPGYLKQLLNSVVYNKTLDKSLNHQGFLLFEYKSPFKIQL